MDEGAYVHFNERCSNRDIISSQRAIFTLGSQYSGSLILAHVLNLLGVVLPFERNVTHEDVIRGKCEWQEFENLDKIIMGRLNFSNYDFLNRDILNLSADIVKKFSNECSTILEAKFRDARLWGVDGINLCRLFPLYHDVVRQLGAQPGAVIVVRSPHEVAKALQRRNGLSLAHGRLFWLRTYLDAERYTRGVPRIVVSYRQLLVDWRSTVDRIAAALALEWPPADTDRDIEALLASAHSYDPPGQESARDPAVPLDFCDRAYEALSAAAASGTHAQLAAAFTQLRDAFDGEFEAYGEVARLLRANYTALLQKETEKTTSIRLSLQESHNRNEALKSDLLGLKAGVSHLERLLADRTTERDSAQQKLEEFRRSLLGRLSKPLRLLQKRYTKLQPRANEGAATSPLSPSLPLMDRLDGAPPLGEPMRPSGVSLSVSVETAETAKPAGPPLADIATEVRYFCSPGPHFEEVDRTIFDPDQRRAKILAYYLPQFHPFAENDMWWGKGFTEWTNVGRGLPRFAGHYQPRIPRDLGFYDLRHERVMEEQVQLAQAMGIFGFCFYFYWFNQRRLLERPLESFLARKQLQMPFCLMWANENWTRRWDGQEQAVLMRQEYDPADEPALLETFVRHFADDRYIRIGGRPVMFIYRPRLIPDPEATLARWRHRFKTVHGEDVLLVMAQTFGDLDPGPYGLDAAVEFPPHCADRFSMPINFRLSSLDPDFTGTVYDYDAYVDGALIEPDPSYDLIRTVVPSWDNDARRQGTGVTIANSTPEKYAQWLRGAIEFAERRPFHGEKFVCVNAWNEWAEAAYLEPDVHFGGAYLNATARVVCGG